MLLPPGSTAPRRVNRTTGSSPASVMPPVTHQRRRFGLRTKPGSSRHVRASESVARHDVAVSDISPFSDNSPVDFPAPAVGHFSPSRATTSSVVAGSCRGARRLLLYITFKCGKCQLASTNSLSAACEQRKRRYLSYLRFGAISRFLPQAATPCTDVGEVWHQDIDEFRQISPRWCRVRGVDPIPENFMQFRNKRVQQCRMPCEILKKLSGFVGCFMLG